VAEQTLTDRTARAARWRAASALVGVAFQFAIGVLLARLLPPADFGVMALAVVVLGLARPLGDLGIGGAIVQRAELTERHVRTGFTFSTLWGLAVAAAIVAAAPLSAVVMRDPEVTPVLRVLAVGFAVGGTAVVAGALLRRTLDFRTQFFIETGSYVLGYGAVASALALRRYGVWSLVWGGLAQTLLASGAQLAAARHSMRPFLARRELADLLHFGLGAAMSGWVNYLALNGDNFVVGRSMGAASLGLYSRAYALMNLPYMYAANVMSSVLFPAFAQAQGEPARLRRGYLLMTRVTAMIAAPAMSTLAIAAPHLVRSLYGPNWIGVVAPLQILCAAGYFRALYHLGGIVVQSVGWVYSELWRQAVYAGLVIAGSLVGSRYDLGGVAMGVSAAILYMFFATAQLALRATGTPWRAYFRVQFAGLATAAAASGAALAARQLLETWQARSGTIALAVVAAAAVPSSIGLLWNLGDQDLDPLRAHLPVSCVRLAEMLASWRRR
jgi:O-antigen/teichoic acid export membrane protein